MRKKSNPIKVIIAFLIFVIFCIAVFFFVANRDIEGQTSTEKNEKAVMTATQEVLARNLETNYPPSPRELLKYYSEITRCFYSEKYSEEELEALAKKSRELFDAELYATQTDEDYLKALKGDIESYKNEGRVISSYSVSSSTDVDEYNYGGDNWAQLYCLYSVRIGTNITPVQEKFLLRKDEKGHWKIVGWQLVED